MAPRKPSTTTKIGKVVGAVHTGSGDLVINAQPARREEMPSRSCMRVFVSYARKDARWLQRLRVHLKPLVDEGLDLWDDSRIAPGAKWREEIEAAISSAAAAVLLVSADFLASDFIRTVELPSLLERAEEQGTKILPLIVGPCRFAEHESLSAFQAFNSPDATLASLPEDRAEAVLVRVAQFLSRAVRRRT